MCSQVDRCRLGIGHFELETVGSIVSGTMRINLFDANVTGTLVTTKGRVSFTTLTFSSEHVFLIDLMPEGEEADLRIRYVAEHGICNGRYLPDTYVKNPAPGCFTTREKTHNYHVCQHRLLERGDYAEAYTLKRLEDHIQVFATVDNSIPANHLRPVSAASNSVAIIERVLAGNESALLEDHHRFWHQFYAKSFLSLPDMKWEGFYWIQVGFPTISHPDVQGGLRNALHISGQLLAVRPDGSVAPFGWHDMKMVAEECMERLPLRHERPGGRVAAVGRQPRRGVHLAVAAVGGKSAKPPRSRSSGVSRRLRSHDLRVGDRMQWHVEADGTLRATKRLIRGMTGIWCHRGASWGISHGHVSCCGRTTATR